MGSFQQRPIRDQREEFELELRALLTKEAGEREPTTSELRKADGLALRILDLYDKYAGR